MYRRIVIMTMIRRISTLLVVGLRAISAKTQTGQGRAIRTPAG
jgi:hypothetical protein